MNKKSVVGVKETDTQTQYALRRQKGCYMKKQITVTIFALAAILTVTAKAGGISSFSISYEQTRGYGQPAQYQHVGVSGQQSVSFGITIGGGYVQPVYTPVPVVYTPVPVVCAPAPVVCAPAPIVIAPRPVVLAPRPVIVAPPPRTVMTAGYYRGDAHTGRNGYNAQANHHRYR